MTPKQLAEEGLRERLLEAVLAHTGVQPGWPHYDAGRVVVLVLDAIEPAIEAEFKAQAEEFRRLAAEARALVDDSHPWGEGPVSKWWADRAEVWDEAAELAEEAQPNPLIEAALALVREWRTAHGTDLSWARPSQRRLIEAAQMLEEKLNG